MQGKLQDLELTVQHTSTHTNKLKHNYQLIGMVQTTPLSPKWLFGSNRAVQILQTCSSLSLWKLLGISAVSTDSRVDY